MKISTTPITGDRPTWSTMTLEVAGGLFTWDLDAAEPYLQLWRPDEASWLWRLVGEAGHVEALTAAAASKPLDLDVTAPAELSLLRRLAWGHWLRRWWPTSPADGIDGLAGAVLDVEVALLTDDCEAYFDADAFDGDPQAVLAAHDDSEIDSLAMHYSPEVRGLHQRWLRRDRELAVAEPLAAAGVGSVDDYALAAGPTGRSTTSGGIARGRTSLSWEAVPANTFDAAEDTVSWSVDAAPEVFADVSVALLPGRTAVPLRVELSLPDPPMRAHGTLDTAGTARIALPLSAAQAWSADWSTLECRIGGASSIDSRDLREQVRALIRRRIDGTDTTPLFVAEQLVADSDY